MKNEKKHSGKTRAKQGSPTDIPEPNKIAVSTPFDFDGQESYSLRRTVPGGHHAGEAGVPETGGENADGEAKATFHECLSIRDGDGAGHLRRGSPVSITSAS